MRTEGAGVKAAADVMDVADTAGRVAHRDPNVLRWLAGFTASGVGDNVYYLAVSWTAVQSGTPLQAGLVTVAGALPRAVLMLGGGVLADRYGPRRVVLASTGARCGLVLSAALLLILTSPGLWTLGAVAVVFGIIDAAFLPAAGALPALIADPGQFGRVQGLRGLSSRLANVLGGPLGGLGVAVGGTAGAFGVAALLIGVSWPVLAAVRVRAGAGPTASDGARVRGADAGPGDADGFGYADDRDSARARGRRGAWGREVIGELVDGVRYVRRDRVLAALVVAVMLSDLGFVGPMNLGLTLLAGERGWGASGLGLVLAGFGVGAGGASLVLAWRGRVPRAGLVLAFATVGGALAIATLARVPSVAGAAGVALCVGLLAGLGGALAGTLVQTRAGAAYIGRVTAVSTLIGYGVAPLTFPVVGWTISLWGTAPVFTACAMLNGLSAVVVLGVKGLRKAELPG